MCGGGLGATISSVLGTVVGGTIGGVIGGPAGAAAGASIGQAVFGRNAKKGKNNGFGPGGPSYPKPAQLKNKENAIQKSADKRVAAARKAAGRGGTAGAPSGNKRGTLLTSALGVADSSLNLGKSRLGD